MPAPESKRFIKRVDISSIIRDIVTNFRHEHLVLSVILRSLALQFSLRKAFQKEIRHYARSLDADYSIESTFQILRKMETQFPDALSSPQWDNLKARTKLVYDEYEGRLDPKLPRPKHIFVIHPRTRKTDIEQNNSYGDAAAFCPELGQFAEYSGQQTELFALEFLNSLPPFRAAITRLVDSNEQDHFGAIVCVPFDLDMIASLTNGNGGHDNKEIAQIYRRMLALADFCYKTLGATNVGLGASTPAMTEYGQELNDYIKEMLTTTGHGMTVALMLETMYTMAQERKIPVEQASITLIGCGRVGTAFSTALLQVGIEDESKDGSKHKMPQQLILFDKNPLNSLRLAAQLAEKYKVRCPQIQVVLIEGKLGSKAKKYLRKTKKLSQISIVQQPDYQSGLVHACDNGSIIVGAATSSQQTQLDDGLSNAIKGKPIIDDSQPTFFDKSARLIAFLSWVSAVISRKKYSRQGIQFNNNILELSDNWDFGPQGLERDEQGNPSVWGCELELLLLFLQMIENPVDENLTFAKNRVHDAVTPAEVVSLLRLFEHYKEKMVVDTPVSALQSFGERIHLN